MSTLKTLLVSVRAPVFRVPIAPADAPGLIVAELPVTLTAPLILPEPPRVPELLTVTVPAPVEFVALFANNVPPLTVVPPEYVFVPVRVRLPVPSLVKLPPELVRLDANVTFWPLVSMLYA